MIFFFMSPSDGFGALGIRAFQFGYPFFYKEPPPFEGMRIHAEKSESYGCINPFWGSIRNSGKTWIIGLLEGEK